MLDGGFVAFFYGFSVLFFFVSLTDGLNEAVEKQGHSFNPETWKNKNTAGLKEPHAPLMIPQ